MIDKFLKHFEYDPISGDVYSLHEDATITDSGDYVRLWLEGDYMYAHRFAFAAMGVNIPEIVDHVNRIKYDNRWVNLRASDKSKNAVNQKIGINNKTGITGVCWSESKQRWLVSFCNKIVGRYNDFFEACCHRKSLEVSYL